MIKSNTTVVGGRIPINLKKALDERDVNISKIIRKSLIRYAEERNIKFDEGVDINGN